MQLRSLFVGDMADDDDVVVAAAAVDVAVVFCRCVKSEILVIINFIFAFGQ